MALYHLFILLTGLIRRGDLTVVSAAVATADKEKAPETAAEKYSAWLKQIFQEAWSVDFQFILELFLALGHQSQSSQISLLTFTLT